MTANRVPTVSNAPSAWGSQCKFSVRQVGDVAVVAADGGLDLASAPELKWAIVESFAAGHRHVAVDLSAASFVDSMPIGVLVAINRKLADDQRLAIGGVAPSTLEVFKLAGVDHAFRLHLTVEAAIADLRGER